MDIRIDRQKAARYGVSVDELQSPAPRWSGENIGEVIRGRERYPINLRYPRDLRDNVDTLRVLPVVTASGSQVALGELADIVVTEGPPMLKSENARLSSWIYVDLRGRDLKSAVDEMQKRVEEKVVLPQGVSLSGPGSLNI